MMNYILRRNSYSHVIADSVQTPSPAGRIFQCFLGQMNVLSELVVAVVFQTTSVFSSSTQTSVGRKAKYQQSSERAPDRRWEAGWLAAAGR